MAHADRGRNEQKKERPGRSLSGSVFPLRPDEVPAVSGTGNIGNREDLTIELEAEIDPLYQYTTVVGLRVRAGKRSDDGGEVVLGR